MDRPVIKCQTYLDGSRSYFFKTGDQVIVERGYKDSVWGKLKKGSKAEIVGIQNGVGGRLDTRRYTSLIDFVRVKQKQYYKNEAYIAVVKVPVWELTADLSNNPIVEETTVEEIIKINRSIKE